MSDLLWLVWVHFVADFVLQSDLMALNKNESFVWLLAHSVVYALPFLWWGWVFALVTGIAHFCVDGATSTGTSRLWKAGQRHWFFVLIGFDQAVHITILVQTLKLVSQRV